MQRLSTFHLKLASGDAALTGRSAAGIIFRPSSDLDPHRPLWSARARSTSRCKKHTDRRPRSGRKCGLHLRALRVERYERPH